MVSLKRMFYENGNIKEEYGINEYGKKEGRFVKYQQDIISSEFTKYMKNHNYHIEYECYYENGVLTGPYIDYYDSIGSFNEKDIKKSEYNYNKGILEGECIGYYKSGAIKEKGYYENGKMQGQYIWYHENGQLSCIYNLSDGKVADGEFVSYHENGQIAKKCNYKNGKLVGKYVEYDKYGGIVLEGDFSEGKCIIYDNRKYVGFKKYDEEEYQLLMLREIQTNNKLVTDIYFSYNPMEDKIPGEIAKFKGLEKDKKCVDSDDKIEINDGNNLIVTILLICFMCLLFILFNYFLSKDLTL